MMIRGSWLSYFECEGDLVWKIDNVTSGPWKATDEQKLVSDSSQRLDSKYIREKNYDQAQK